MLSKKETKKLVGIILFLAYLWGRGMKQEVMQIASTAIDSCEIIFCSFNSALKQFNDGKGIVHTLCAHPITFSLVGIVLPFMPFDKKTNRIIGKGCYWLIERIISTPLKCIENKIFK